MGEIRALVFDFWGTMFVQIVPDEVYYGERVRRVLRQCGITDERIVERATRVYMQVREEIEEKRKRTLREIGALKEIEAFFCRIGLDARVGKDLIPAYSWPFLHFTLRRCGLDVLFDLRRRYALGVLSNSPCHRMVVERLEEEGIRDLFSTIVTSELVGVVKPHPDIFKEALRSLDVSPEEAVMIGDSLNDDIEGAKRVGMKTVLVGRSSSSLCDAVVTSFDELPEVLEAIS